MEIELNTDHIRDLQLLFEYSEQKGILKLNPDLKTKVNYLKRIYCPGSNAKNLANQKEELIDVLADLAVGIKDSHYRSITVELGRILNGVH